MDRTSDEELVYLYVLKRKEDKRIRSSIAKHITGSSKNYSRAASICKPSIITIQKFVRRFILKNSITSQVVHNGSCSSSLNIVDPLEITTTDDGSNHSTRVITLSIHLSPRTTTDECTAYPTQDKDSTTSGTSTKSNAICTYTYVRPWGELLCSMIPSKIPPSDLYVDTLVDTSTKECEFEGYVGTCMYVTLANKKIGECMYAFLIKDWQWIDTEVKKYATRAIESSVGNLPPRFAKNHPIRMVMDVDLMIFFLEDSLCLEGSTEGFFALHLAFIPQGRWGDDKSTLCEEEWGVQVHSNDHESLLLFNECLWLRMNLDLTSGELQVLILDILSHLRTWAMICPVTFNECEIDFNCPVTFAECELNLQNLRTCGDIFQLQKPRSLAM